MSLEIEAFEDGHKVVEEPGASEHHISCTDIILHPFFILKSVSSHSLIHNLTVIVTVHEYKLFLDFPED